MIKSSTIIAGLEIGTAKIRVAVAEQTADGTLNLIGLGQSCSRGVRKGEIINRNHAEEDVRAAVFEAEQIAGVKIRSVVLGVTGDHVRGVNLRGVHPVLSADHKISTDDVSDVIKDAKTGILTAKNWVIHAMPLYFQVDGQAGVAKPVGLVGAQLEVEIHIIQGNFDQLQNVIRLVRSTSLEVENIVFNGIASAQALLTREQKKLGALVITISDDTAEYVAYANGVLQLSGVITTGDDHVSDELGRSMKTPFFQSIAQELKLLGTTDQLRAGVFLCGGLVSTPGIVALAETTLQMKAIIGHACDISGIAAAKQPEFATAIGIAKYGAVHQPRKP